MQVDNGYVETVRAYADGVRVLLAPAGLEAGERGRRGPASYTDLAAQAENLLPISEQLTREAAARLDGAQPAVRTETEATLLAKALTDLEVGSALLEAAQDEETAREWGGERTRERRVGSGRAAEPYLEILLGEREETTPPHRGATEPRNLPAAQLELVERSGDALSLISAHVAGTSKTALGGLVGLGMVELASAVAVVGKDVAKALGQAENATRLYQLFQGFLLRAYDSIAALLGPQVLEMVKDRIEEWAEKIKEGEPIGRLLERLYETKETKEELKARITSSEVELDRFTAALAAVEGLSEAFRQKTSLVDKILPKMKWLTMIPAAVLPHGRLLLAATYVVLSGYVMLVGADYVDAPRLQRLGRVPGVRLVVEANLAPA
jgi:hypothetical protein